MIAPEWYSKIICEVKSDVSTFHRRPLTSLTSQKPLPLTTLRIWAYSPFSVWIETSFKGSIATSYISPASAASISVKLHHLIQPSVAAVMIVSPSSMIHSMCPLWSGALLSTFKTKWALTRLPSQRTMVPYSVPETILPSGNSWKPVASESSSWPYLAISPYNLSPVNVCAIFQNLMWPLPPVKRTSSLNGEKLALKTSWLDALHLRITRSLRQSQTVRV